MKTHPDLRLEDVIALDKVQKNQKITDIEMNRLQEIKLIDSDLKIRGYYPKISFREYKQMILNMITQKGSATREDIVNLIMPTLSPDIPIEKRQRKISNITAELAYEDKLIENISKSTKASVWVLINNENINGSKKMKK